MKTKDLFFIAVITYLTYHLIKTKNKIEALTIKDLGVTNLEVPKGNSSNGGLNLGVNMDLPNLTAANGLPTEVALNTSNIKPMIKESNEPTQIYGNIILPTPFVGSSSSLGSSLVAEPSFPIKTVNLAVNDAEPNLSREVLLPESVTDEITLECGNNFSIPNNDREGSYVNYWFDGKEYYTQTSSPMIQTIATKISKILYLDGCKKFYFYKMQYQNN